LVRELASVCELIQIINNGDVGQVAVEYSERRNSVFFCEEDRLKQFLILCLLNSFAADNLQVIHNGVVLEEHLAGVTDNSEWYAVRREMGFTNVEKVKISVSKKQVYDGVKFRNVSSPGQSTFLIKGKGIQAGNLPSLYPGTYIFRDYDPQVLNYDKFSLTYYATFGVPAEEFKKNPQIGERKNYRLFFEMKSHRVEVKPSDVASMPYKIIWMGDLNKDGFPDVLLQPYDPEKQFDSTLFVSEKKEGKFQLKEIGTLVNVLD